jgi:hypothetical protein
MDTFRSAEAGDICVLLLPDADERMVLRKEQQSLVNLYGGWIVPEAHITLQRFRIAPIIQESIGVQAAEVVKPLSLSGIMQNVQTALSHLEPFTVHASRLIHFLAPYWGTYVLRWEVQCDDPWKRLVIALDKALIESGCELHYDHSITPTCSAVDMTHEMKLDEVPTFTFPRGLFTARRVLFSGVLGANDFETLGMAKIGR